MLTQAIVRIPGKNLADGITTANLGRPDYHQALEQHAAYIQALEDCRLQVRVLEADQRHPDSTFIEDVALLTEYCAIILNPGAPSRKGEPAGMEGILREYYQEVHQVASPGTVEGGDILQVEDHYYIGLTERTNPSGAEGVIRILEGYGLQGTTVPIKDLLHLKTGLAYLDGRLVTADSTLVQLAAFQDFPILRVDPAEAYAANCLFLNGTVLLPEGFPKTKRLVEDAGWPVLTVDVSEFRKLDGGLSCLSLRC